MSSSNTQIVKTVLAELREHGRTAEGPDVLIYCLLHDLISYTKDRGQTDDALLFAVASSAFIRGLQETVAEAMMDRIIAITEADAKEGKSDGVNVELLVGVTLDISPSLN